MNHNIIRIASIIKEYGIFYKKLLINSQLKYSILECILKFVNAGNKNSKVEQNYESNTVKMFIELSRSIRINIKLKIIKETRWTI